MRKDEALTMNHFAYARDLRSSNSGFVANGWMTVRVKIELLDRKKALRASSSRQGDDPPMCVFCLVKPQTSGFAHTKTCVTAVT